MKNLLWLPRLLVASFILVNFSTTSIVKAQDASSQVHKLAWPRVFQDGATKLTIYQPDIEKWDGNAFQARSAVAVQGSGQDAPTFGVIWLTARADVDKTAGIVTLNDIQITKSNFPTEPDKAATYLAFIQKQVPAKPVLIPLAQIDNSLLLQNAVKQANAQPVQNQPPQIIFSKTPALLILVDGEPVLRPVGGTGCQRVFNTHAVIVQGAKGGPFYLTALKYWFKADALTGPWTPTPEVPKNIAQAGKEAIASKQVDPINPPEGQEKPATPPAIYLSTGPAELVQTQGDPNFVPIPDTQLLEVKNSDNAIILDIQTQLYYVLISGRWFSSKAMTGPWAYVDGKTLPADFAKIPPDSDKGAVLVSVPNTPQAQEAVIANSIPQTATVKRSEAKLTVSYDGAPNFQPIPDTNLLYAVNTPLPVIEVSPGDFYCVANGVWFYAPKSAGPWVVATAVAPVIYTIPISSPLHYVTYVRVYGSTPEVVYVGYTPGYYGTVVTPDGVVVYGTGYSYPPYVGTTVYVAQPATYGYGAGFSDGEATGFAMGFIAGAVLGACLEPHWGCWGWGYGWGGGNTVNVNINNGNVYNKWGNNTVVNHSGNWNGNSGWASRSGGAYNPYNGNYAAGHQSGSYNSATGRATSSSGSITGNTQTGNWNANGNRSASNNDGAHGQAHTTASGNSINGNYNSTTTRSGETANGTKAAGISNTTGNSNTGQHDTTHTGAAYNPNTGNGAVWHDGNVYTNKDGGLYKKSDDGGWQSYDKNGWQNAQRNGSNSNNFSDLDRQSQGWNKGNDRFESGGNGGRWGGGGSGGGRFGGGGGGGGRRR